LAVTAAVARTWFEERAAVVDKAKFHERGGLNDNGSGSVYAYFDAHGKAVYVGQTGRNVKARLYDETSPHKQKAWWHCWSFMRFLQVADETDRLVLESLLIAGYEPGENAKPKAKSISTLLPD
jgi:excinuclease UvrABC nuclease subunit